MFVQTSAKKLVKNSPEFKYWVWLWAFICLTLFHIKELCSVEISLTFDVCIHRCENVIIIIKPLNSFHQQIGYAAPEIHLQFNIHFVSIFFSASSIHFLKCSLEWRHKNCMTFCYFPVAAVRHVVIWIGGSVNVG